MSRLNYVPVAEMTKIFGAIAVSIAIWMIVPLISIRLYCWQNHIPGDWGVTLFTAGLMGLWSVAEFASKDAIPAEIVFLLSFPVAILLFWHVKIIVLILGY